MPYSNGINSDTFGRDDVIRTFLVLQYFGAVAFTASAGTAVNNLTSNSTTAPLAAAQGAALKALIDALAVSTVDGGTPDSGRTLKLRHGTAAEWAANNPVLADGEIGVELDTRRMKVGYGNALYNSIPYFTATQNSLDSGSSTLAPTVDAVKSAIAALGTPGTVGVNTSNDITASRSLTSADFDGNIRRVTDTATVTVPPVSSMSLSSTPNQLRTIGFLNLGGLSFYAASGVTINGIVGPSVVVPIGGAVNLYGFYTLTQTDVGADTWALQ